VPITVKLTISLIVVLVAAATFALQDALGQTGPKYAVIFLGLLMVVAMWLFPEVTRKVDGKQPK
jgi:hypothetical protein